MKRCIRPMEQAGLLPERLGTSTPGYDDDHDQEGVPYSLLVLQVVTAAQTKAQAAPQPHGNQRPTPFSPRTLPLPPRTSDKVSSNSKRHGSRSCPHPQMLFTPATERPGQGGWQLYGVRLRPRRSMTGTQTHPLLGTMVAVSGSGQWPSRVADWIALSYRRVSVGQREGRLAVAGCHGGVGDWQKVVAV